MQTDCDVKDGKFDWFFVHLITSQGSHSTSATSRLKLADAQRVDAFFLDHLVVGGQTSQAKSQMEPEEAVGANGSDLKHSTKGCQLRSTERVQRDLVFKELGKAEDFFVGRLLAGTADFDEEIGKLPGRLALTSVAFQRHLVQLIKIILAMLQCDKEII